MTQQIINNIEKHMGFSKDPDGAWVLESPDGGKTITKRKPGSVNDKFMLENISGRWHSIDELRESARRQDRERVIRAEYPAAQEAWEIYQSLLQMIEPDIDNNKAK